MESAISVTNLYKKYSRNATDHLAYGLWDLLRELTGRRQPALREDEFYAVNGVSFELAAGCRTPNIAFRSASVLGVKPVSE